MITKALNDKKAIKDFALGYKNENFQTEVISNLLQPFHAQNHPEIKDYCDFLWPNSNTVLGPKSGLPFCLQMLVENYAPHALKDLFGSHDFKFTGNREYKNYILKFEDLTIIAPQKRSVVLPNAVGVSVDRAALVRFEQQFSQTVFDFIGKNFAHLPPEEKEIIFDLQEHALLSENYQINFDFFKNQPKIKNKILK